MELRKGVDYIGNTVVFACHDGEGNYLLAKRSAHCRDEQETWDIGGGGIEFSETVEETLRKEIREEYCTDVLDYEFLGFRDVHREKGGVKSHWIALDFKVRVNREHARIGEPHKLESLGWYRLSEFPKPLHSQLPHFLEKYHERLV